jgi:hypothetical protein
MKIRLLLTAVCFSLRVFSQSDSTAYQIFYADFLSLYKEIAAAPLKNYYDALDKTASFTFTPLNPRFVSALSQTTSVNNVSEANAVDSLFLKVFNQLKTGDLWLNAKEIYKTNEEAFTSYNDYLCPCISSKITNADMMDKLLAVVKKCSYDLVKDSSFINTIKKAGKNNTLNEFYRLQQYFSMYVYNNCDILNYKMNETIKNSSVFSQYYAGINYLKKREGENAIRFFNNKQWDSLAIIFPGYKKYTAIFNKILIKLKKSSGIAYAHFNVSKEYKIPEIVLTYKAGENMLLGEVVMATSSNTINSNITSIKYIELNKNRGNEQILVMPAATEKNKD